MAAGEDSDWGKKMNRRNVLGNKIEQSKTTWVVLIGIFVTALQFVIFYFFGEQLAESGDFSFASAVG